MSLETLNQALTIISLVKKLNYEICITNMIFVHFLLSSFFTVIFFRSCVHNIFLNQIFEYIPPTNNIRTSLFVKIRLQKLPYCITLLALIPSFIELNLPIQYINKTTTKFITNDPLQITWYIQVYIFSKHPFIASLVFCFSHPKLSSNYLHLRLQGGNHSDTATTELILTQFPDSSRPSMLFITFPSHPPQGV